jgi:hypothetical protein
MTYRKVGGLHFIGSDYFSVSFCLKANRPSLRAVLMHFLFGWIAVAVAVVEGWLATVESWIQTQASAATKLFADSLERVRYGAWPEQLTSSYDYGAHIGDDYDYYEADEFDGYCDYLSDEEIYADEIEWTARADQIIMSLRREFNLPSPTAH